MNYLVGRHREAYAIDQNTWNFLRHRPNLMMIKLKIRKSEILEFRFPFQTPVVSRRVRTCGHVYECLNTLACVYKLENLMGSMTPTWIPLPSPSGYLQIGQKSENPKI